MCELAILRVLWEREPAASTPGLAAWRFALRPGFVVFAVAVMWITPVEADDQKVIVVDAGQSIQMAIDTAPPGAVIRLGAGEWKERIVITRAVTVEGAGAEKTRLTIDEPPAEELGKAIADLGPQLQAATTPEEKRTVARDWVQRVARPAIWVHDARDVKLQSLRVQGVSKRGPKDGGTTSTLVVFQGAHAAVSACAIVGPFGNGLEIADASDVEIRESLIAAMWMQGITVRGRGREGSDIPSRLHLSDSEVRNVYHYGIAIGAGCDTTLIERCRISGSAWHGIRYDDASPTILSNVISGHARSGIYASGGTRATVRDNSFWKNEMSGISCWLANADTIEANTFTGNLREGLAAIGGATPTVKRNLFTANPIAIVCSMTSGRNGQVSAIGAPVLEANLFWENQTPIVRNGEKQVVPAGSLELDPQFRDAAKFDFTLAPTSPARAARTGAADPLPPVSRWPLLAEEQAIIPSGDTREYTFWTAPGEAKRSKAAADLRTQAMRDAQGIVTDAHQLDDPAKRTAALDRIRVSLEGRDLSEVRMGLAALQRVTKVEFDKEPFQVALRNLLASPEADIRAGGLLALGQLGPNPEDLERALTMVDDPASEVRLALPGALALLSARDFTGKTGAAVLKLLDAPDGNASQAIWHAMWGTKISPELELRVVDASRKDDRGTGYSEVFYYALTVHLSKREPTVTRLIELAASIDAINVVSRVLWGLRQGVEKDQQPRVAELALKLIAARSDDSIRRAALDLLRDYGTAAHVEPLQAFIAKPGTTGDFRKSLEETVGTIEKRPAD